MPEYIFIDVYHFVVNKFPISRMRIYEMYRSLYRRQRELINPYRDSIHKNTLVTVIPEELISYLEISDGRISGIGGISQHISAGIDKRSPVALSSSSIPNDS
jgi:hypothetical protein